MISDCLDGQVDLILTKSISRFARNTVDTVTTIRKLKDKGVGGFFEKENIDTLLYGKNANKCGKYGTFQRVMVFGWCLNLCDTVIRY